MGVDRLLAVGVPLLGSAEAAAVGASLRCRHEGVAVDVALAARLDAVLDALGILDALESLSEREMVGLSGLVESFLGQSAEFAANPARTAWDHSDPGILRTYCRFRGSVHRPGRGGQRPPRLSIASAMTACCEW